MYMQTRTHVHLSCRHMLSLAVSRSLSLCVRMQLQFYPFVMVTAVAARALSPFFLSPAFLHALSLSRALATRQNIPVNERYSQYSAVDPELAEV